MENKRTRKPPTFFLKDSVLSIFLLICRTSLYQIPNFKILPLNTWFNMKLLHQNQKQVYRVRRKIPSSTNILNELDKTIAELTIEIKYWNGMCWLNNTRSLWQRIAEPMKRTISDKNGVIKIKSTDHFPYILFKDKQKRRAVSGEARAAKDRVKYDLHMNMPKLNHWVIRMKTSNSYTSVVNYLLSITFQIAISKLRRKYLINLLYFAEKYHFTEIKDLHAEVLLSLERGHKHLSHMFFF